MRMSIRTKMLVAFVGLGLVPVLVLAVVNHVVARHQLLRLAQRTSSAEMAMAADGLQQRLEAVGADAAFLAQTVARVEERGELDRTFLDLARRHPEYLQLRYLDEAGVEKVRVERLPGGDLATAVRLQDKSSRYYFGKGLGLRSGAFYLSPLDANVEDGVVEDPPRYVYRVVTPVHREGVQAGVIVVNLGAEMVFAPLRNLRASRDVEVWVFGERGSALGEVGAVEEPQYLAEDARGFRAALDGVNAVVQAEGRLHTSAPLRLSEDWTGEPWTVSVSQPAALIVGDVERLGRRMAGLVLLFAGFCVFAAIAAARALANPMESLAEWARRAATGTHDPHFRLHTRDEIEDLADALRETTGQLARARALLQEDNDELREALRREAEENERLLHERMAAERQILHADRLASLGLLATSLAHEIGNPLAGVQTNLDLVESRLRPDAPEGKALRRASEEVSRLGAILKRVTGFAIGAPGQPGAARPLDVVGDVWELVAARARNLGCRLELRPSEAQPELPMDVVAFRQICLNVLLNSLQAEPSPTLISVTTAEVGDRLAIRFEDDGPGFGPEALDRAFEPLFTTRSDGTGLGLAIVRRLCRVHHAEVVIGQREGGGARVTLWWPLRDGERAAS